MALAPGSPKRGAGGGRVKILATTIQLNGTRGSQLREFDGEKVVNHMGLWDVWDICLGLFLPYFLG